MNACADSSSEHAIAEQACGQGDPSRRGRAARRPGATPPTRPPAVRGSETESQRKRGSEASAARKDAGRRRQHAKRANEHMRAGSCRPWLP